MYGILNLRFRLYLMITVELSATNSIVPHTMIILWTIIVNSCLEVAFFSESDFANLIWLNERT